MSRWPRGMLNRNIGIVARLQQNDLVGAQARDGLDAAAVQLQHSLVDFAGLVTHGLHVTAWSKKRPDRNNKKQITCSESPKSS